MVRPEDMGNALWEMADLVRVSPSLRLRLFGLGGAFLVHDLGMGFAATRMTSANCVSGRNSSYAAEAGSPMPTSSSKHMKETRQRIFVPKTRLVLSRQVSVTERNFQFLESPPRIPLLYSQNRLAAQAYSYSRDCPMPPLVAHRSHREDPLPVAMSRPCRPAR